MAQVTVSADDAVAGTLPPVCVKTGEPADRMVRFRTTSGGIRPGQVVALLLLGPLGLLVPDGSGALVLLPLSGGAAAEMRNRRRARALGVGSAALLVLGVLLAAFADVIALAVAVVVFGVLVLQWRADRAGVGVALDASGRWVTLSGVAPAFVAAVEAGERSNR